MLNPSFDYPRNTLNRNLQRIALGKMSTGMTDVAIAYQWGKDMRGQYKETIENAKEFLQRAQRHFEAMRRGHIIGERFLNLQEQKFVNGYFLDIKEITRLESILRTFQEEELPPADLAKLVTFCDKLTLYALRD